MHPPEAHGPNALYPWAHVPRTLPALCFPREGTAVGVQSVKGLVLGCGSFNLKKHKSDPYHSESTGLPLLTILEAQNSRSLPF